MASARDANIHETAKRLLTNYATSGQLDASGLDGSFTIILLDSSAGEVVFFRNLVGTTNTYYSVDDERVYFGSNLAELVRRLPDVPDLNDEAVPIAFLSRYVPGRETLFKRVFRVRPGELVRIRKGSLSYCIAQTFADLVDPAVGSSNPVDAVEAAIRKVLGEHAAIDPQTVNLLSGGVDSTLLQAIWKTLSSDWESCVSFAATVDHEVSRLDRHYARTASSALQTDHHEVEVIEGVDQLLREHVALTGELPNHLQSVYFAPLSRAIASAGFATVLCGEGADSLFGNDSIVLWQRASQVRRIVRPLWLCHVLSRLSALLGRPFFSDACRLAVHMDDTTNRAHPLNHAGTFADWDLTCAAFGTEALDAILERRRKTLDEYQIDNNPLARIHASALLHEGIETASLWSTSCNAQGIEVVCPYLDSRVVRVALSCDQTKRFAASKVKFLLRHLLARYAPFDIAFRDKLGFAQPVFEWLSHDGHLADFAKRLGQRSFLRADLLRQARAKPTWFLYTAVCLDQWIREYSPNH